MGAGGGSRPSTRSGDFDAPRGVGRSAHPGGNAPRRAFSICVPSGSSGSACAWKCVPARGDATRRRAGAGRTTPRARGPAGRVRGPRVGASAGARTREPRAAEIADQRADAGADDAIGAVRARMRGGRRRAGDEENPMKPVSRAPGLAKTDRSRPRTKATAVRRFRLDRAGHENLIRLVRDIFRIFRCRLRTNHLPGACAQARAARLAGVGRSLAEAARVRVETRVARPSLPRGGADGCRVAGLERAGSPGRSVIREK